jgi:hypothetical protein
MNDHTTPRWTLATLLEADVTRLDHAQTVDYLRAISQAEARLQAARLRATQHFSVLHERAVDVPVRLARELKITRNNAARDVRLADALTSRLPHTLAALDKGELDAARAAQVVRATGRLTDVQARSVDDRLYPLALDKKPKPLSDFLRNAVAQEDSLGATEDADLRRSVPRKATARPEEEGVTRMKKLLDKLDLAELDRTITGLATRRKRHGDPRAMDELRLAALHDRLLGKDRSGFVTHVHVVATVDTLAGFSDLAGMQRGYGLIPAERVRELAFSRNAAWTLTRAPYEVIADLRPERDVRSRPKRSGFAWWRSDMPAPWLSKARRKTSRRVIETGKKQAREQKDEGSEYQ